MATPKAGADNAGSTSVTERATSSPCPSAIRTATSSIASASTVSHTGRIVIITTNSGVSAPMGQDP
jgi:hypothetical protein